MEEIKQAQADFLRSKERVQRAIATTPDDRLGWSPSPTARTPLQIEAHAAMAIDMFGSILDGKPIEFKSVAEEEAKMRSAEKKLTSRKEVADLFNDNAAKFLLWLDTLTPTRLEESVQSPFGPIQVRTGIAMMGEHLRIHAAQIDYIQTIYGDYDWHIEGLS